MGEKTMNIEKAILIMRNELECAKAADECDRHCEDCPLAMEAEDIIECYEWIIDQMEKQKKIIDKINNTPATMNLLRRYNILN